jgi:sialate O-acetylesterase
MPNTPSTTFIRWKAGGLYNAMIAPLIDFKLKGVIWYQGESDTGNPELYSKTFPKLINSWRSHWNQPNLPFLFVQLTNFMEETTGPQDSKWAELREVQRKTNNKISNTGMAVTIDLGEWNDIHPLNKKDVGIRLALEARRVVYNEEINSFGPSPKSTRIVNNSILIKFENINSGWKFVHENYPKGFTISGDGKVFYEAIAEVHDQKTIKVYSKKVSNPKIVRYAWANNPGNANIFNNENLPAVPFEININNK